MRLFHRFEQVRFRNPLLVTLTTLPGPDIECQLADVYQAWSNLLRSKLFKGKARFGLKGIEVKPNPRGWYLHLHVLVDYKGWLSQAKLSRSWFRWTGAYVVDVRKANKHRGGVRGAVMEVCKYVCAGFSKLNSPLTPGQVDHLGQAIERRRLFSTFGKRAPSLDTQEITRQVPSLRDLPCPICGFHMEVIRIAPSVPVLGGQEVKVYDFSPLGRPGSPSPPGG